MEAVHLPFYVPPMMRTRFIAFLLVPVLLTGCGRSASGQKPTPEQLSDALPTITDLAGGWEETQRQIFDVRDVENPSLDPSIWCPEAIEVTKNLEDLAGQSGADVEMSIQQSGQPTSLMRIQAWSNDDVDAYYGDAAEAARICDGKTTTDDAGVTSSTKLIAARDIGDESISWSEETLPPSTTQSEKMAMIGRTTIARFGDILMVAQIGTVDWTGDQVLMDEDQWWDIIEIAGKRLDQLDEQVHD